MSNVRDLTVRTVVGLLAAASMAGAGCGSSDTGDPGATAAASLSFPADVARVLQANCASCHATAPHFGAPMSLVTYADTQRAALSAPARRVWQLMGERVHDPVSPMPATRLSAPDLAVIDAWVAAGAPGCSGATCGTVNGTGAPDPVRLPCTPTHAFAAHADGAQGAFTVPAGAGNVQKCFAFRSPFTTPTQATAFGPRIDNAGVLHHMILYATDAALADGAVFDCNGNMPRDARFVAGWAPGNRGSVMPADVGVELSGAPSFFILQVHYWNTASAPAPDASALQMCTTTELRAHAAAVTTLGSLDIEIPARATDHAVVGECTPQITGPVHLIGAGPHMHRNGTALRTEILRGGADAASEMLVDVPNYSFDSQVNYPVDTVVMPGDRLRTTCRYRNPGARPIYFGERTEDEMCFDFVLAWPAGALANGPGARARRCIDAPVP